MYGQATSGKTFSMLGNPDNPGIIPCSLRDIFSKINSLKHSISYNIYVSYIEIYNENIYDLLLTTNSGSSSSLKIVDDPKYGVSVAGCKKIRIKTFDDGINLKDYGEENRKYRETYINEYSSRSHSIFQIVIRFINNSLLKLKGLILEMANQNMLA